MEAEVEDVRRVDEPPVLEHRVSGRAAGCDERLDLRQLEVHRERAAVLLDRTSRCGDRRIEAPVVGDEDLGVELAQADEVLGVKGTWLLEEHAPAAALDELEGDPGKL